MRFLNVFDSLTHYHFKAIQVVFIRRKHFSSSCQVEKDYKTMVNYYYQFPQKRNEMNQYETLSRQWFPVSPRFLLKYILCNWFRLPRSTKSSNIFLTFFVLYIRDWLISYIHHPKLILVHLRKNILNLCNIYDLLKFK